jgi:hypothetical protein
MLVTFISILIPSWNNGFSLLQTRPDRIMGPNQPVFFKEIYCTERICSVYNDKLQNCFCNHLE